MAFTPAGKAASVFESSKGFLDNFLEPFVDLFGWGILERHPGLRIVLAEAGTDKKKLLTVQIWLSDMRFFADMNSVYDTWVTKDSPPARATSAGTRPPLVLSEKIQFAPPLCVGEVIFLNCATWLAANCSEVSW